jgi:hypothetical protein
MIRYRVLLSISLPLTIACLLVSFVCLGSSWNEGYVRYDSISLTGRLSNDRSFTISVAMKDFEDLKPRPPIDKYWLIAMPYPGQIIDDFQVSIDGRSIALPDSSYDDLTDIAIPIGLRILNIGDTAVVRFLGGDGAGAFTARFFIADYTLIRKSVVFMNSEGEEDSMVTIYQKP